MSPKQITFPSSLSFPKMAELCHKYVHGWEQHAHTSWFDNRPSSDYYWFSSSLIFSLRLENPSMSRNCYQSPSKILSQYHKSTNQPFLYSTVQNTTKVPDINKLVRSSARLAICSTYVRMWMCWWHKYVERGVVEKINNGLCFWLLLRLRAWTNQNPGRFQMSLWPIDSKKVEKGFKSNVNREPGFFLDLGSQQPCLRNDSHYGQISQRSLAIIHGFIFLFIGAIH